MRECLRQKKGITLGSLIITIVILIILSVVSLGIIISGGEGIINSSKKAKFYKEMTDVKESKNLAITTLVINDFEASAKNTNFLSENLTVEQLKNLSETLKAEIIFARNNYEKGMIYKTKKIWEENRYQCQDIFQYDDYLLGLTEDIYYVNGKFVEKEEKLYIYDQVTDICYKVSDTKLGNYIVHSLEYARLVLDGVNSNGIGIIDHEAAIMESTDGVICYEPDLNNFSYTTEIVYYSPDKKTTQTLNIKDYLEKESPKYLDIGGIRYTFADYSATNKVWANVKFTANGLDSYWVWVPRYAYKLGGTTAKPTADVIYVNIENKLFNGSDLPDGYTVHEAFAQSNDMKGIWFSKYNPTSVESDPIDISEPAIPDLTNFNKENTKLVYYTIDGKNSIKVDFSENPEQTKVQDGTTYYFYNYAKKLWANVYCNANGIESYWVWIPRYAYKLESGTSSVILVDINDNPIDTEKYGTSLPSGYTVHEAFTQEDGLEGIWFSKYNPTKVELE